MADAREKPVKFAQAKSKEEENDDISSAMRVLTENKKRENFRDKR